MSLIDRIELAKQAKVANQQMRRLEKAGYTNSPAYKSAQAYLTSLGVKPTKGGPRRFPESYKSVDEDMLRAYQKGVAGLREPDNKTGFNLGTVAGFRAYYNAVYEVANKHFNLKEAGVSQEDYYKMWAAMPDKDKDRIYGSRIYIRIISAYNTKYGDRATMSGAEIAKRVNEAGSFFGALKAVGLSVKDYTTFGGEA